MSDAGQMFSDGKVYERMMGRWSKRVGVQFLDWLDAPKGLHWIEVGCGNGAFTEELIAHAAPRAVSSIDPSEGQLAFARTRPAAKLAEFRLGDAQALPFPDRNFDAAAMALVIDEAVRMPPDSENKVPAPMPMQRKAPRRVVSVFVIAGLQSWFWSPYRPARRFIPRFSPGRRIFRIRARPCPTPQRNPGRGPSRISPGSRG